MYQLFNVAYFRNFSMAYQKCNTRKASVFIYSPTKGTIKMLLQHHHKKSDRLSIRNICYCTWFQYPKEQHSSMYFLDYISLFPISKSVSCYVYRIGLQIKDQKLEGQKHFKMSMLLLLGPLTKTISPRLPKQSVAFVKRLGQTA